MAGFNRNVLALLVMLFRCLFVSPSGWRGCKLRFRLAEASHIVIGNAALDLAAASRRYLSDNMPTRSLSALCSSLLRRVLPKEEGVRMSSWESTLTEAQASTWVADISYLFAIENGGGYGGVGFR